MTTPSFPPPECIVPLLFGRFLLKTGWVTEAHVEHALAIQEALRPSLGLGAGLQGVLTSADLRNLLGYQRQSGSLLAEALQQLGRLDAGHLAALTV